MITLKKRSIIAGNPNIMRHAPQVKTKKGQYIFDKLPGSFRLDATSGLCNPALATVMQAAMKEFLDAYETARQMAPESPLAYGLAPILQPITNDPIIGSKIGGLPYLPAIANKSAYLKPQQLRRKGKINYVFPPLKQFIADNWPCCRVCRYPMRFVCDLEIWPWLAAIHQATANNDKDWRTCQSFVGSGNNLFRYFPFLHNWLVIWHCANNCNYGHEYSGSVRLIGRNFSPGNPTLQRNDFPWSLEDYRREALDFVSTAEGRFQRDKNWHFDHDRRLLLKPHMVKVFKPVFTVDRNDDLFENFPDQLKAGHYPFLLFGSPQSQQEEHRPACTCSRPKLHHMAPLIAYEEEDCDLTRQLYACLACGPGPDEEMIPAILDSSCS